jgi:ribosomal-protein-alanine N-acetyltransferase
MCGAAVYLGLAARTPRETRQGFLKGIGALKPLAVTALRRYPLLTDYWQLITRNWKLATGHWKLATGNTVKAPERIETPRLVLRRPRMDDAAAIFERYAGDADVVRFLGWPRHQSVAATTGFLAFSDSEWERWPAGPMLIESRADGRLLGGSGFGFETPHRASTGYVLAKDAWGQGYATETLAAVRDLAPRLGLQRLYALCHPDHRLSQRVLEKCGFTREARVRRHTEFPNLQPGVPADVLCYAAIFGA